MVKKIHKGFGLFISFMLVIASYLWYERLENQKELEIKKTIEEVYELANPGSSVTDITLVKDGGNYKAIFKFSGELTEVFIDPSGEYIYPVRTEVEPAIQQLMGESEFYSCLFQKGVEFYGILGENNTNLQISALGQSPYMGLIYRDCGGDAAQNCVALNVTQIPAWRINRTLYEGVINPQALREITGC